MSESVTELLNAASGGDISARNRAFDVLHPQLRASASFLLSRERRLHSIQPTDLIGEVFLKLCRIQAKISSRQHFLCIASRAMRQFLIDRSRSRAVRDRSRPAILTSIAVVREAETVANKAVRMVWERLQTIDPLAAQALWLLQVEGLTLNEVAARQQRPVWRVRADLSYASDWMAKRLS